MKRRNQALTLIELIISSLILTVVMVTIYSAFHKGIFGYRNIEEAIYNSQTASHVLERLNLDLRNSFSYSKDRSMFAGEKNTISFLTLVDTFLDDRAVQNYAFVSYKLAGNKLMRLCRKAKESLNNNAEVEPEEMALEIKEIDFNYGFLGADNQTIEWKNLWDDDLFLPAAVKIKLTLNNAAKQIFERTIFLALDIKK